MRIDEDYRHGPKRITRDTALTRWFKANAMFLYLGMSSNFY